MTVVAGVATSDMCRILTGRNRAVMARAASTYHLGVIDRIYWHPYVGAVAVLTDVAGLNMCQVLAGCVGAVMAIDTIVRNLRVVEIRGQPANC